MGYLLSFKLTRGGFSDPYDLRFTRRGPFISHCPQISCAQSSLWLMKTSRFPCITAESYSRSFYTNKRDLLRLCLLVLMGLFLHLSHFHAREISGLSSLIQAPTHTHSLADGHTHPLACSLYGVCILVGSRLCVFSVSLCDGRSATTACLFFSVSVVAVPHHTEPLYITTDTMITSLTPCFPSLFFCLSL